jgi:hypothetical protein
MNSLQILLLIWSFFGLVAVGLLSHTNVKELKRTPYAIAIMMKDASELINYNRWVNHLSPQQYTLFFIDDSVNEDNIFPISMFGHDNAHVVQYSNITLLKHEFYASSSSWTGMSRFIAWDKAIYLFASELKLLFNFVWFIEDDVLIPSGNLFHALVNETLSQRPSTDLAAIGNFKVMDYNNGFMKKTHYPFPPPYYFSLVCIIGVSRNLLHTILRYVKIQCHLDYVESMFHTLAAKGNMTVYVPPILNNGMITYVHDAVNCSHILERPNRIYHPVKHIRRFGQRCVEEGEWKEEFFDMILHGRSL